MPPILQFLIRRLVMIPVTLFVITLLLYGSFMLTPVEARATIYLPKGNQRITENFINNVIRDNYLDQPFPIQYGHWVQSLLQGSWGYSPSLGEDVLPSLLRRTPVTLELILYSMLIYIPLGLANGLVAGWKPYTRFDNIFRSLAFLATSTPVFILSMLLLALFYIKLGWFPPGGISQKFMQQIQAPGYHTVTGMLSIDSLLNGRLDIFADVIKHLTLPVLTLALYHWGSLGRITRAAALEERGKTYITAARARGVRENRLLWSHTLRGLLSHSLTSIGLSAANMLTGVFLIEMIFTQNGVSSIIVTAMRNTTDAAATLGFAIYSVLMVLGLMILIDLLSALVDPRVRDEILKA